VVFREQGVLLSILNGNPSYLRHQENWMNWQWWIMEKATGAVHRLGHVLARIAKSRWRRQWVDFSVMVFLAAGVCLVSIWVGAMVLFIAVVMLMRRQGPALPISRMADEERDIDETWDESWDSPGRRQANMTHEYSYRAFEDD
jgi:hypothetical protein